jgi:hypothetical protein
VFIIVCLLLVLQRAGRRPGEGTAVARGD